MLALLEDMSCQRLRKEQNSSLRHAPMRGELSLESSIILIRMLVLEACASKYLSLKQLDDKATAERDRLKVNVPDTSK